MDDVPAQGRRLTVWDQNVCAEGHPRAHDHVHGPGRCYRGHPIIEHPVIDDPRCILGDPPSADR